MRRRLLLLAFAASLAEPARAATLAQLEQEVVRLAAEREARSSERRGLGAEVAALAEMIARAKDTGPRAGGELTRSLRALDRAAARLDDLERRQVDANRRLQRAAAAFEKHAEDEEHALLGRANTAGATRVAAELSALAEARRRIAALVEPPRFRPPLEVSLADLDGPGEIQGKLEIIDGERARLAERERELRREESLLAARLRLRREWARELGAARREAGGEVELLERAHESAEDALRELSARAAAVAGELLQVRRWDEGLVSRRREAEERLRSLETRRVAP
jgi:chromosome segregation ATPase